MRLTYRLRRNAELARLNAVADVLRDQRVDDERAGELAAEMLTKPDPPADVVDSADA